ncbi:hypothetical protein HPB47_001347 [Ixodes persulcatus]|uniref:Uncharacterized protein n=1 Tax=Ixodes persulcatus TaxID=34615 RepID=A0AC60PR51_IXOPE|nr:hypothetical protein HPB47_001347 [Ixodes persulcatus]
MWIRRFMKRKDSSIHQRTTMRQQLPEEYEDKLRSFPKYIIELRREHGNILSQIGNADYTSVWFDSPENCARCTVMLCITADGRKLPRYATFKRKTIPAEGFPRGIIVRAQIKGRMNDQLVVDCLKTVWENRPGGMLEKKSLLVLDSLLSFIVLPNQVDVHRKVYIGQLPMQPLDVSVKRPFKVKFRRCYTEWMASGNHEKTLTERVAKSFKVTGISNNLDGTPPKSQTSQTAAPRTTPVRIIESQIKTVEERDASREIRRGLDVIMPRKAKRTVVMSLATWCLKVPEGCSILRLKPAERLRLNGRRPTRRERWVDDNKDEDAATPLHHQAMMAEKQFCLESYSYDPSVLSSSSPAQNVSQRVRDVNGTCVCVRVERPGLTAENHGYDSFLATTRRTFLLRTRRSHLLPWRRVREKTDPI